MKRVHVPEVEDLDWFPAWLRNPMTGLIVVLMRKLGVTDVLADLVARTLKQEKIDRIVDLGSGSGGALPEVVERVRQDPEMAGVCLTMTDIYPNLDAIDRFDHADDPQIRYMREAVNAADLAKAPPGLKTMVNSFHHMRPELARAILESAQSTRQPLLIYELADHTVPFPVWCIALPIALPVVFVMALCLTPFARPLTLRQLFFTYIVPLIPIFYAWDGQASMPRIYGLEDLDELLEGLDSTDYRWEKGHAKNAKGRNQGIYLLGLPC